MSGNTGAAGGPSGGIRVNERTQRRWTWNGRGLLRSKPVRCRREDWYLARARVAEGARCEGATVLMSFLNRDDVLGECCLRLVPLPAQGRADELVGWFQTPEQATHLQLYLPDAALTAQVDEIVLHDVAERDPKCHPLANVPRWSAYQPPFPVERIVLPAALAGLAELLGASVVEVLKSPTSVQQLRRRVRGAAGVIDPQWVRDLKLTLADLEKLAAESWLIVDLETMAAVLRRARVGDIKTVTHESEHGLMSARVEYADVPTRGLALQDVVPYALLDDNGGFRLRGLTCGRDWRRYADDVGFATLLSAETPWVQKHGDVLSAARPVGRGEVLTSDLPWLVAGRRGTLVAPRIATHLLRMHLAQPIDDHLQYWNRWDNGNIVVRDISDLARRYWPLEAVRWASAEPDLAHLGLTLPMPDGAATQHLLIRTGRIDSVGMHDGAPPEPMMIFMKHLAREARERTPWAQRHLAGRIVTWQFDTRDGLKYAANFDSAAPLAQYPPTVVELRIGPGNATDTAPAAGVCRRIILTADEGLHGDGSLALQDVLTRQLRAVLERTADSNPET